jgi:hypothetical protein
MGMISNTILPLYSNITLFSRLATNTSWWISRLITQLLQSTHMQWIYRCVLVHDRSTGTISAHKKELLKEIEHQLEQGPDGLDEQDRFLLECNFNDLSTSSGKKQEYWLLDKSSTSGLQLAEEGNCHSFWQSYEAK